MATVYSEDRSNIEGMIKKFRKKVDRESIILETKKRKYFTKPALEKHEKRKKLERKKRKKIMKHRKLY